MLSAPLEGTDIQFRGVGACIQQVKLQFILDEGKVFGCTTELLPCLPLMVWGVAPTFPCFNGTAVWLWAGALEAVPCALLSKTD